MTSADLRLSKPEDHVQEPCSCRHPPRSTLLLTTLQIWRCGKPNSPPIRMVASSLVGRLGQVPDPRDPRGRRHPLVVMLVLTACATLVVGNDSLTAIRQWAAGTS